MRVEVFLFTGWFCLLSLTRSNHGFRVSHPSATKLPHHLFFCYVFSYAGVFDRPSLTVALQDPYPRQLRWAPIC
jgi:hypothetical protein